MPKSLGCICREERLIFHVDGSSAPTKLENKINLSYQKGGRVPRTKGIRQEDLEIEWHTS